MHKTTTMFAALTCILADHPDTGGLNQAFSVEPMTDPSDFYANLRADETTRGTLLSDLIDLQMGSSKVGAFHVIGGGEAIIGYIVTVCDDDGKAVRTWWAV